MPNQTIASVPPNVEEPIVLKRFLLRLIEELDIVLGYRGDSSYVSQSQLVNTTDPLNTTLASVSDRVTVNAADITSIEEQNQTIADAIESNSASIEAVNQLLSSTVLSSTYHDFNDIAYSTLEGNSEFSTLGSHITNAPYTPVGIETYYNFINSVITANGGVVQTLRAYSTTTLTPTTYFRIGDTWADVGTLGWI